MGRIHVSNILNTYKPLLYRPIDDTPADLVKRLVYKRGLELPRMHSIPSRPAPTNTKRISWLDIHGFEYA